MDLLLDTHAMLWFAAGDRGLRAEARSAIETADRAYVSAASMWEMAAKAARGRLDIPADLAERLRDLGMLELAIGWEHAMVAGSLPDHHRDPVDRLLVGQAIVERLTIVTRDAALAAYDVPTIEA